MYYYVSLRIADRIEPAFDMLSFNSLEEAYLDACAAIPDTAADLLRKRRNPFRCAYIISDESGRFLLNIPFHEVLPPSERDDRSALAEPPRESAAVRLKAEIDRSRDLIRRAGELKARASGCIDISRGMVDVGRRTPTLCRAIGEEGAAFPNDASSATDTAR
jgi:hypothetical protein